MCIIQLSPRLGTCSEILRRSYNLNGSYMRQIICNPVVAPHRPPCNCILWKDGLRESFVVKRSHRLPWRHHVHNMKSRHPTLIFSSPQIFGHLFLVDNKLEIALRPRFAASAIFLSVLILNTSFIACLELVSFRI